MENLNENHNLGSKKISWVSILNAIVQGKPPIQRPHYLSAG